jgi:hypothetical protein
MSIVNKFLDRPGDLNKRLRTSAVPQPAAEDIELVQFTEVELNFQMGGMYLVLPVVLYGLVECNRSDVFISSAAVCVNLTGLNFD